MANRKSIEKYSYRHPYIGPVLWLSSFQFFLMQYIVAVAWPVPYSIRENTISDLGVTTCGEFADRYVCSPWYTWMNASLVALGFSMLLGSILLYYQLGTNRGSRLGFIFMGLSGVGTTLVGLFPANIAEITHAIGAFLPFFIGNIGLVLFGKYLPMPSPLRVVTLLAGVVSLLAFLLFSIGFYLSLGVGGMERIVAHPQTIWLIGFGIYVTYRLKSHKPLLPQSK